MPFRLVAALALLISVPASAGTIFRCTDAQGRTEFSQTGCKTADVPATNVVASRAASSSASRPELAKALPVAAAASATRAVAR